MDSLRGSGNSLFTKSSLMQRTRHERTNNKEVKWYILTSCFIPRQIVDDVLNEYMSNRFERKLSFKEKFLLQFSNAGLRPIFLNNSVNFIKNVKFRLVWSFK